MSRKAPMIVFDDEGTVGFLDPDAKLAGAGSVSIHLEDGQTVAVTPDSLSREADGRYRLLVSRADLEELGEADGESETVVVPVVAEEIAVGKRKVQSGKVRIKKEVTERVENVDIPLIHEEVEVERVAINRPIDGPVAIRHEGDVMIVPVVEEVLVVEKRLILKEELHIRRKRVERRKTESVTLRTETAKVEREGVPG